MQINNSPDNSPDAAVPSRIGPATKVFEQSCPEIDQSNYFRLSMELSKSPPLINVWKDGFIALEYKLK